MHEESRGTSQAEGQDRVLIQPVLVGECRLRNILRTDPQLKIARTQINLREYTSTSKQIKQILNTGQWMLVLMVTAFNSR